MFVLLMTGNKDSYGHQLHDASIRFRSCYGGQTQHSHRHDVVVSMSLLKHGKHANINSV
jgi:hypothetical protein